MTPTSVALAEQFSQARAGASAEPCAAAVSQRRRWAERGKCSTRWERWWDACEGEGVKLEDCSGGLLGNLPQDPVGKDGCDEVGDTTVFIRQPVFQLCSWITASFISIGVCSALLAFRNYSVPIHPPH